MSTIHYSPQPYSRLKRQQLLTLAYALEDTRDRAIHHMKRLYAVIAAVNDLHTPERRFTTADGDYSWGTPEECAEANNIPLSAVEHFDICAHCGALEMHNSRENSRPGDYMDAMWPCKTSTTITAARDAFEEDQTRAAEPIPGLLFDSKGNPICTCTVGARCGHHPLEEAQ